MLDLILIHELLNYQILHLIELEKLEFYLIY
jgi:hypothetical protein